MGSTFSLTPSRLPLLAALLACAGVAVLLLGLTRGVIVLDRRLPGRPH